MTSSPENTAVVEDHKTLSDTCLRLKDIAARCRSTSKYYRFALRELAQHFGAQYAAIHASSVAGSVEERVQADAIDPAPWSALAEAMLLQAQSNNASLVRSTRGADSATSAALAVPLCEVPKSPNGAVVIILECASRTDAEAHLEALKTLVSITAASATAISATVGSQADNRQAVIGAVAKASDYESLHELAFAVVNGVKNKYDCDQVALGWVHRETVRILAISGLDEVRPSVPGTQSIRQAMEECLDGRKQICYQLNTKWSEEEVASGGHRLHKQWHEGIGSAAVASIPLFMNDRCVAVLSMSRPADKPFAREDLETIRRAVDPFGPALQLVARANRSLVNHAVDTARTGIRWLTKPGAWGRPVATAALLVLALWFCFGSIGYKITVPCRISPTQAQHFAAPFEGTIGAAHVKVGQEVSAGQLLFSMDTTPLELQAEKLRADIRVAQVKADKAVSAGDIATAALANAEIRGLQARLDLVQHDIQQAQARAPCDGTVIAGDLSKRTGEVVPMGEPLMQFVPRGNWLIDLEVPEGVIRDVRVGQSGRFSSNARPEDVLECTIQQIQPAAEPVDGNNVFIAEATVPENPPWMRVGMEGVARINAGNKAVWWVALHRVVDYLRQYLWL